MSKTSYIIPMTPEMRENINSALNDRIKEIETCEDTPLKGLYMLTYNSMKTLFNALPDGYPLPVKKDGD